MKRLIAATLAVTLLGTAAASAQPFHHGYGGGMAGIAAAGTAAMTAP